MSFAKFDPAINVTVKEVNKYWETVGNIVTLPTGEKGMILRKYPYHAMTTEGDYQMVDIYFSDVKGKRVYGSTRDIRKEDVYDFDGIQR